MPGPPAPTPTHAPLDVEVHGYRSTHGASSKAPPLPSEHRRADGMGRKTPLHPTPSLPRRQTRSPLPGDSGIRLAIGSRSRCFQPTPAEILDRERGRLRGERRQRALGATHAPTVAEVALPGRVACGRIVISASTHRNHHIVGAVEPPASDPRGLHPPR